MDSYEFEKTYKEITIRLELQRQIGDISEEELVFVRDFAMRMLSPDRFSFNEKVFICSECGKIENVVESIARTCTNYSEPRWTFRQISDRYSGYVRGNIGGCSAECFNSIMRRLKLDDRVRY